METVPKGTERLMNRPWEPHLDMYPGFSLCHPGNHEENHECGFYGCHPVGFRVLDPDKFKY